MRKKVLRRASLFKTAAGLTLTQPIDLFRVASASLLDFHDLSRETLLVIAIPDLLLLLPMALIEGGRVGPAVRRRLLRAPPLYWRSPLIARHTMGRESGRAKN